MLSFKKYLKNGMGPNKAHSQPTIQRVTKSLNPKLFEANNPYTDNVPGLDVDTMSKWDLIKIIAAAEQQTVRVEVKGDGLCFEFVVVALE